jgi:hypothetical protein
MLFGFLEGYGHMISAGISVCSWIFIIASDLIVCSDDHATAINFNERGG